MQPPGSTHARYLELAGYFDREVEDQEDLWLLVLERWHLTVDQWESLPWWQQQAYLTAHNRKVAAENAETKRQADEAQRAQGKHGKVAGRKGSRRPSPKGKGGDESRARTPAGGGRTKLRDHSLWAGRKQAPAALPRMTGQRPTPGA